jgi:ribonuclease PH
MPRIDDRAPDALRPIEIERGFLRHAEGSALIRCGNTHVLCAATIELSVPRHLLGAGTGWVTAEYSMLPRSSAQRVSREVMRGRPGGRTQEIMRLIGRSMRSVVDLAAIGERTIILDCDVIEADGGTRTASITGACIALHDALSQLELQPHPMKELVAAISVGIRGGEPLLDLCYEEDSSADVDLNVVMADSGRYIEVQGTAEKEPFDHDEFTRMLGLAHKGCRELFSVQRSILEANS